MHAATIILYSRVGITHPKMEYLTRNKFEAIPVALESAPGGVQHKLVSVLVWVC